jgi:hypothetical protein
MKAYVPDLLELVWPDTSCGRQLDYAHWNFVDRVPPT